MFPVQAHVSLSAALLGMNTAAAALLSSNTAATVLSGRATSPSPADGSQGRPPQEHAARDTSVNGVGKDMGSGVGIHGIDGMGAVWKNGLGHSLIKPVPVRMIGNASASCPHGMGGDIEKSNIPSGVHPKTVEAAGSAGKCDAALGLRQVSVAKPNTGGRETGEEDDRMQTDRSKVWPTHGILLQHAHQLDPPGFGQIDGAQHMTAAQMLSRSLGLVKREMCDVSTIDMRTGRASVLNMWPCTSAMATARDGCNSQGTDETSAGTCFAEVEGSELSATSRQRYRHLLNPNLGQGNDQLTPGLSGSSGEWSHGANDAKAPTDHAARPPSCTSISERGATLQSRTPTHVSAYTAKMHGCEHSLPPRNYSTVCTHDDAGASIPSQRQSPSTTRPVLPMQTLRVASVDAHHVHLRPEKGVALQQQQTCTHATAAAVLQGHGGSEARARSAGTMGSGPPFTFTAATGVYIFFGERGIDIRRRNAGSEVERRLWIVEGTGDLVRKCESISGTCGFEREVCCSILLCVRVFLKV